MYFCRIKQGRFTREDGEELVHCLLGLACAMHSVSFC